MTMFSEVRFL